MPTDIPSTLRDVLAWFAGLIVVVGGIFKLRTRKSADDTDVARNKAEASIYSTALADTSRELAATREVLRQSESKRGELHALNAGLMARQEATDATVLDMRKRHLTEITELQRQIDFLRKMIGRLADPETRRILGSEFASSQHGSLDEER